MALHPDMLGYIQAYERRKRMGVSTAELHEEIHEHLRARDPHSAAFFDKYETLPYVMLGGYPFSQSAVFAGVAGAIIAGFIALLAVPGFLGVALTVAILVVTLIAFSLVGKALVESNPPEARLTAHAWLRRRIDGTHRNAEDDRNRRMLNYDD